jgi:hypothetical protein
LVPKLEHQHRTAPVGGHRGRHPLGSAPQIGGNGGSGEQRIYGFRP